MCLPLIKSHWLHRVPIPRQRSSSRLWDPQFEETSVRFRVLIVDMGFHIGGQTPVFFFARFLARKIHSKNALPEHRELRWPPRPPWRMGPS
jgi:hypothetical protein